MIFLIVIFSLIIIYEIKRNMNKCDKNYIEFDNKIKTQNNEINSKLDFNIEEIKEKFRGMKVQLIKSNLKI